jgi:hypothetical protein
LWPTGVCLYGLTMTARLLLPIALALLAGACVRVKPWQREHHAKPVMTERFGEAGLQGEYRSKVTETKTGAGVPGDAPGGGCGCSQ